MSGPDAVASMHVCYAVRTVKARHTRAYDESLQVHKIMIGRPSPLPGLRYRRALGLALVPIKRVAAKTDSPHLTTSLDVFALELLER